MDTTVESKDENQHEKEPSAECTENVQYYNATGNAEESKEQQQGHKGQKLVPPDGMSKNQMKKMLRKQRWEEQKMQKRACEKQKKKQKRQAKKALGEPLPVSRKLLKRNAMKDSACKVNIAIDCSFDDLMNEKFHITSLSGKAKVRLDSLGDYKNWDVYTHAEDYVEVFGKDSVVYLTSESPNILDTLEDGKAYIIGGLVDHNHQKGLCYRLAQEKGIAHAQLPISDYMELKSRKVLTINHVFEILVQYTVSHSWEDAFFKVIPNRKVNALKASDKAKLNDTTIDNAEQAKDRSGLGQGQNSENEGQTANETGEQAETMDNVDSSSGAAHEVTAANVNEMGSSLSAQQVAPGEQSRPRAEDKALT